MYIVSRGNVRVVANPRFNQVRNSYEITFDANTSVTLVRRWKKTDGCGKTPAGGRAASRRVRDDEGGIMKGTGYGSV